VGGSSAGGVVLVGAVSRGAAGVLAFGLFAAAPALSMAYVSTAFGLALARARLHATSSPSSPRSAACRCCSAPGPA
jgi:hypothetical protein